MNTEKPKFIRTQYTSLIQFQDALAEVMGCSLNLDRIQVWEEVAMWAEEIKEELDKETRAAEHKVLRRWLAKNKGEKDG